MTMETDECPTPSAKKRTAEESCSDGAAADSTIEEPCAKKPKLSKKEMLEQAKARLKEAQEKKKLLQQKLEEEEKKREAEVQEPQPYDDYDYAEDYYYEYHIPPVTGPKDSLLISDIASTGPADKVAFIEDKKSCIEEVLKVINGRKRSLSPVNAASPWIPQAANPQGPPAVGPLPPQDNNNNNMNGNKNATASGVGSIRSGNNNNNNNINDILLNHKMPPRHGGNNHRNNGSSDGDHQHRNNNRGSLAPPPPLPPPQRQHSNHFNQNQPHQHQNKHMRDRDMRDRDMRDRDMRDRDMRDRDMRDRDMRDRDMRDTRERDRERDRDRDRDMKDWDRDRNRGRDRDRDHGIEAKDSRRRESHKEMLPRRGGGAAAESGNGPPSQPLQRRDSASLPPQQQRRDSTAKANPSQQRRESSSSLAPQPPPKKKPPPTRPWKLALAQITGKTLDCTLDLPTKTQYMIRTQDQGIVAHVQFFSVPDNPALLQHNPSKRHLQDHLLSVQRLPCNTSKAWKAQDVLSFLQHQDERRTTYQPPARRNLPLSHWALLDLEQPLHQAHESLGYFTAVPQNSSGSGGAGGGASDSNASNNKNNKKEITFAGKLVWNMNDFYHNQDSGMRQRNNSKLSKWGEVVSATPTTGIRNSALIATVQGFYETPPAPPAGNNNNKPPSMPPALRARKVILPKSRTIGIIIGVNHKMVEAAQQAKQQQQQQQQTMGCVHVLFPNGMASGPSSVQSLKGARAILYD